MDAITKALRVRHPDAEAAAHSCRRARRGLLFSALVTLLLEAMDRMRQRRALQRLDDRLLKDIGLTRADVEWEISRPFWRI